MAVSTTRGRQNPPYGASLNYWLKPQQGQPRAFDRGRGRQSRPEPEGRQLGGDQSGVLGLANRTVERGEAADLAALRPAHQGRARGAAVGQSRPGRRARAAGPIPVKLVVNGQTLSAPLEVRKDPNTGGTEADIKARPITGASSRASSMGCRHGQHDRVGPGPDRDPQGRQPEREGAGSVGGLARTRSSSRSKSA